MFGASHQLPRDSESNTMTVWLDAGAPCWERAVRAALSRLQRTDSTLVNNFLVHSVYDGEDCAPNPENGLGSGG